MQMQLHEDAPRLVVPDQAEATARMKIDKAFVRQLGQTGSPRIAEIIVELGQTLGLRVLAEGIEDRATWDALQTMGCHEGQGYFIARPMPAEALMAWLNRG